MQFRNVCWLAGVLTALLWLPGCRSASRTQAASKTPSRASAHGTFPTDDFSAKAVERRTEAHARYANGFLHLLNDETDEGVKDLAQAASLDPGNERLVLEVTGRLVHAKKNEQALELLTKATEQPSASGLLFARLAAVNLALGRKEAAIEAGKTAIHRNPRLLAGYQCLAQIYFEGNQRADGLKILAQAAQQENIDAGFLIELAELYLVFARSASDPKVKAETVDLLKRAEKFRIANPILLQRLGDAFDSLGEADRATAAYAKLLEQFPHLTEVRRRLADHYLRKSDLTNATAQLEVLIRENPTAPRPYFILGAVAFEQRKLKEAIEFFNKALLLDSDYEPVYYELAGAQISANEPRAALDTLARARAKFKETFQSEYYAALAYNRMKEYSNAVPRLIAAEVIAGATATNRLNAVFYFQLGAAYERNQQYEEAEKTFRKVLAVSPDFSEALNYLGYMWAERGMNLPEARQLIEKAVQQEPKNAAYLDSLGWVLFKQGKPAEALPHMLKAVEYIEAPDATLYDHLGDIYAALNQPEKAREAWKKALSVEPSEAIRKKLGDTSVSGGAPR
jgi:tetratricopeptide (TPR) repeat protein